MLKNISRLVYLVVSVNDKSKVTYNRDVAEQEPENQKWISFADSSDCLTQIFKRKNLRALHSYEDECRQQHNKLEVG